MTDIIAMLNEYITQTNINYVLNIARTLIRIQQCISFLFQRFRLSTVVQIL